MSTLRSSLQGELLLISFDNEKFANSFGLDQAEELMKIIKKNKKAKALIFTADSSSRFFCTGGNLKKYAKMKTKAEGMAVNLKIRKILKQFSHWPILKVAVVNGDCFGGGMELLSCFDKVFATPSVFLGFWQRRVGLTFGWGGGGRWLNKIGSYQLKALCLEARSVEAYEAQKLGLVDVVCEESLIFSRAKGYIQKHLELPEGPGEKFLKLTEKNEAKSFSDLWLAKEHKAILKRFIKR